MCGGGCDGSRCRGCPDTDFSAYTWLWETPDATVELPWGGISRLFKASSRKMGAVGTCECIWQVGAGDTGRDIAGTNNPVGLVYPIGSVGALLHQRSGTTFAWKAIISRYGWFGFPSGFGSGSGWGWDDDFFSSPCGGYGYGGFGFNGYGYGGTFGWGGYGWGDPASLVCEYKAPAVWDCSGGVNQLYLDPAQLEIPGFIVGNWPAWVKVSRVLGA